MPVFELNLDGHPARLTVSEAELEAVHLPLLHCWESQWRRSGGRFVVFLAGPPGAGKTWKVLDGFTDRGENALRGDTFASCRRSRRDD